MPEERIGETGPVMATGLAEETAEEVIRKPNLLELAQQGPEGEKKAAQRMVQEWNDTYPQMRNLFEQWKANRAQREGFTGITVLKERDTHRVYIPITAKKTFSGMNKAARLTRRLRARIFSDEPVPDAEPEGNSQAERDQAEFSARVLSIVGEQVDVTGTAGDAFDLGSVYASGLRHWWVDPRGNGHRPMQIQASPQATTVDDALIDPETNEEWLDDPILRYVDKDDVLSDEKPDDPRRVWLPRLRNEVLSGKQVRLIPFQVRDIDEADGAMIGAMVPLGVVKSLFPKIKELDDETLGSLTSARPDHSEDLVPSGQRHLDKGDITDDSLVFVLTRYHKSSPEYEFGAYLVVIGNEFLGHFGSWYDEEYDEPLDIPLDQFKQINDEDSWPGKGLFEFLGPGNEIRAQLLGSLLEHLDRFNNRKVFVPLISTLQAQQAQSPTATYIPIVPGGEPKTEDIPNFPAPVKDFLPFVSEDMDDESALQETAQGVAAPSIQSGRHAQQVIEQVNIGLADLLFNTRKGLIRGWRIMLQLIRAFYTVPQRISWLGDDGAYKEKLWTGTDLGTTKHVQLKRGSMTMMAPSQKTALAGEWMQMGWISAQEAKSIVTGNIQALSGLRDDPHRMRVRRQINHWLRGPPDDWQPPEPQINPQTQQEEPAPALSDPVLGRIFQSLPMDLEPEIADLRRFELGRAMATTEFGAQPPEWQAGLAEAYTLMRQAAGLDTLEEQQQAQQQQAEAAQQQSGATEQAAASVQQTKLQETQIKAQAEVEKSRIASEARTQQPAGVGA